MPSLTIPYSFSANTLAQSAQANANFNAIATLLNTTKLDSSNIQAGGLATSNYAAGSVGTTALASNAVTTVNITDSNITTAKIANANVTSAKLASGAALANIGAGGILASYLVSNINLPGTAVQANGQNLIVSAANSTTNLAVAWAYIPAAAGGGSAPSYGQGVSTITQPNSGNYTMQFTTAFASTPVIFALPVANSYGDYVSASSTTGASTTEGRVQICTAAGAAATRDFFFLAIGPR